MALFHSQSRRHMINDFTVRVLSFISTLLMITYLILSDLFVSFDCLFFESLTVYYVFFLQNKKESI